MLLLLVELIVVIAILGIIVAIAVPGYLKYVNKAKEEVCNVNCLQLEKMYEMYLEMEVLEHSETLFQQFLDEYEKEICPSDGVITYIDGEVSVMCMMTIVVMRKAVEMVKKM